MNACAESIRERTLLASILADPGAVLLPKLTQCLEYAESWQTPECAPIALAVRRAKSNGRPCTLATIGEYVADDQAGALMQLANETAIALPLPLAEVEAETLLASIHSRRVVETLAEAYQEAREHPERAEGIAQHARDALEQTTVDDEQDNARPWIDVGQSASDADVLIGPGRWITRGAGVLLVAYTGTGKSTWTATQSFSWAIGRESLGMRPNGCLRSLIFQAEDDAGDLDTMAKSILAELEPSEKERELIRRNVLVITESAATGIDFLRGRVAPALRRYAPDLLWINPVSTYFGADLNDQREIAVFFRNTLNPLLLQHHCTCFGVHHCPKPTKERSEWTGGQLAYAGAGSADMANWAREVITLRETSPGLFEMSLAKRWRKIGWTDAENRPTAIRLIAHDLHGGQVWRDATPAVLEELGALPYSDAALVALVPDAGIDRAELVRRVVETFSVTDRTASKFVADARRERRRNVNGACQRFALLSEQSRPRREVYPDKPQGRPVLWLTKTSDFKENFKEELRKP